MPHRMKANGLTEYDTPTQPVALFAALRKAFAHGYGLRELRQDALAGAVVGVIAIPLSMALAISVGVAPQYGLYTAVGAGFIAALLGGSRFQVTGPTAAFVVILVPIVNAHGLPGLLIATMLAGFLLIAMGAAHLGRLIEFVPYPVITGFTAGIAVVIATLQVRDLLGMSLTEMPEEYIGKVEALIQGLPTASAVECAVGAGSLALLLVIPRINARVPAPLVVLPVAALAAYALEATVSGIDVATINDRFSFTFGGETHPGIPQMLPVFALPWSDPEGGESVLSLAFLREIVPSAFAIAVLAAIESLLSAVVADSMTGGKHNPDSELVALGMANVAVPFFGGFAATGALARTAANIRFGARSPIAAMIHAVVVLGAIVFAAPLLGYLPMASLAALLLVVAWNMSEARHFVYLLRIAPRSDVFVLVTCFGLTVLFDMVVAVTAGLILAAILFIRRMAEVGSVRLVSTDSVEYPGLPPDVLIYGIAGPLFFGAAERAMARINVVAQGVKTVIFDLQQVPAMDVTGLINFESAIAKLRSRGVDVVIGGAQAQPRNALAKAGWDADGERPPIFDSVEEALAFVQPDYQRFARGVAGDNHGPLGTDVY